MNPKDKRDAEFYNLLPGEREKIRAFQGNLDPITGEILKPYAALDHCHRTGEIRGLLNPMTNKFLIDRIEILQASIKYLQDPPAAKALGERVYGLMGKAQKKRNPKYGPDGSATPRARAVAVLGVSDVDLQPRRKRVPRARSAKPKVRGS